MGAAILVVVFSCFVLVVSMACTSDSPPPVAITIQVPTAAIEATIAATATVTATPRAAVTEPAGLPIDPSLRLGLVVGEVGSRTIAWGAGPEAQAYSRDDQVSEDAVRANAGGWDCRTHQEYEGRPAVDWYIAVGTPIRATLDGIATLNVISLTNAFDFYREDREPYIGNPDRERAPLSPFPGSGGGKGVFVEIANDAFVTEYAHLDFASTLALVPENAFVAGYSRSTDYVAMFSKMRAFDDVTAIARWQVQAGDVIGYSGDSGYSEAPHLHYTVRRAGNPALLCPTNEPGFGDGGWLFR